MSGRAGRTGIDTKGESVRLFSCDCICPVSVNYDVHTNYYILF